MPSTQDLVDFFKVFSFVVAIYWSKYFPVYCYCIFREILKKVVSQIM